MDFQVKNLLTIDPEDEAPVKSVTLRRIPRYFCCMFSKFTV